MSRCIEALEHVVDTLESNGVEFVVAAGAVTFIAIIVAIHIPKARGETDWGLPGGATPYCGSAIAVLILALLSALPMSARTFNDAGLPNSLDLVERNVERIPLGLAEQLDASLSSVPGPLPIAATPSNSAPIEDCRADSYAAATGSIEDGLAEMSPVTPASLISSWVVDLHVESPRYGVLSLSIEHTYAEASAATWRERGSLANAQPVDDEEATPSRR